MANNNGKTRTETKSRGFYVSVYFPEDDGPVLDQIDGIIGTKFRSVSHFIREATINQLRRESEQ